MNNKSPITEAIEALEIVNRLNPNTVGLNAIGKCENCEGYTPQFNRKYCRTCMHKIAHQAHTRLAKFAPLIEAVVNESLQDCPFSTPEESPEIHALLDAGWPVEELPNDER